MGNQPGKLQTQSQIGRPKKNVHWKSAERPSPPGRPILIPLSDQQPDTVNLKWERPKLDGGSPLTGYVVEHRRMGSPHWVRATPLLVTRCEVSICGLEPGWRYQFRVFAENIVGRSESSELSDALTVTLQRNAITVPRFVDELQDKICVENERIELRVRILGEPPPEINWFKDGYEIFSSRRMKIVNDNDVSILIIHQVALTDEGEIKCTATNRAGHVVTKAKLLVQAPPKIRLPRTYEDGLIVEADEMLRLKVGIAGQPQPGVTWLHEGNVILNDGHFEMLNTDKNSLLKINHIKRVDRGEYTIKALNKLGEDISSFLVTVTSRPDPPGKVCLNMSFGKSATLSWTAPMDDGGCKIGNYIVEYFRIGWNVWLKAATARSLTTTLHDLIEGSEYKFRVKAENPYGVSEPSEESDILFIPDSKRGIVKPKSNRKLSDQNIPIPSRRKTHSPSQGVSSNTASFSTPIVTESHNPQLLDNVNLHREMSYGTSDQLLKKDIRKNQSVSNADIRNGNHFASKVETLEPDSNLSSFRKFSQKSSNLESILPLQHTSTDKQYSQTQPNNKIMKFHTDGKSKNSVSNVPILNRVRSLSPLKKPSFNKKKSTTTNSTLGLLRSAEPVKMNLSQDLSEHSLSPAKHAPLLAIAIATSQLGNESQSTATKQTECQIQENPQIKTEEEPPILISEVKDLPNKPRSHSPNVMVEPSSPIDKHDDVHTSNEFMLVVFNKNSNVKKNKQNSFELDLEEAIQPSSISISAPELAFLQFTNLHTSFSLRRSVSSSELLYERAMARFYEAVELEEAEKLRKNKSNSHRISQPYNNFLNSLSSKAKGKSLPFEESAECQRQLGDNIEVLNAESKWKSCEIIKDNQNAKLVQPHCEYKYEHDIPHKEDIYELGSDYTDSTASTEDDSIEKFKIELMARTRSLSPQDLKTYHPRSMSAGIYTPYPTTSPEHAAIVLNRPLPLPSPDFIPKPILKRPLKEYDEQPNASDSTLSNFQVNEKSSKLNLSKDNKDFFKCDEAKLAETSVSTSESNSKLPQSSKINKLETKLKVKEEDFKSIEETKIIQEEAHAAVNHYNDLMHEVSSTHKYHTPLYLDRDELKKVSSKIESEDDCTAAFEEQLQLKPHIPENESLLTQSASSKPRLSISERGQMMHVRHTPSNLAVSGHNITTSPSASNTLINSSAISSSILDTTEPVVGETTQSVHRGRTRLVKVKRIIKRRVPSSTHSRDVSSSRLLNNNHDPNNVFTTELILQSARDKLVEQHFNDNKHSQNEAHDKVRSALGYSTDLVLFVVACYVYLFKDARLVLPILALMIYRQLGEAINGYMPNWMKRKPS